MPYVLNPITGITEFWTDEQYVARRDALLAAWMQSSGELERVKYVEANQRKEATQFLFNPNVNKGTETLDLGSGWTLKSVKQIYFGFVKRDGKTDRIAIKNALDEIASTGSDGQDIAYRLISWEPKLSQKEYDALSPEHRRIIDRVIVTTDGMPSLKLTGPDDAHK